MDSRGIDGKTEVRASATTVVASTQVQLTSNLKNHTTITLGNDVSLVSRDFVLQTGVIVNGSQTGLIVDGLGLYKLDGQNTVRCFYIGGSGVDMVIQNLEISQGQGNGGGLYIYEATVHLTSCTITTSNALARKNSIGGGLYINVAAVRFVDCTILHLRARRRNSGISFDDEFIILAGALFSTSSKLGTGLGSDLYVSMGSNFTVLSSQSSSRASERTDECSSCSTTYPADLLSGECTLYPTQNPSSLSSNTDDKAYVGTSIPSSFQCDLPPSGAIYNITSQPTPAITPNSLQAAENFSRMSFAFFATSGATIFASVVIIISCYLRIRRPSRNGSKNQECSEADNLRIYDAIQDNEDYDSAQEYVDSRPIYTIENMNVAPYTESLRSYDNGSASFASSFSEATRESHEIASTYGAEHTFIGSSDHGSGGLYRGKPPFDVLISHLHRHGLEMDTAAKVAGYLSRTFGVRSVGDFRLLGEADVVKTAKDVGLLKVPAVRLRIAWR